MYTTHGRCKVSDDHGPSREMDVAGNQFCICGDYYPCPTVILLGLIAELRDQRDVWLDGGMDSADDAVFQVIAQQVAVLTDRAEARLYGRSGAAMPTCSKCTDADLGRICPHQGPGREVWEQGRAAGRAEVAVVLLDLIAQLRDSSDCNGVGVIATYTLIDNTEERLREVSGNE